MKRKAQRKGAGTIGPVEKVFHRTRSRGATTSSPQVLWYEQPDADLWEFTRAHVKAIRARQVRRRYELAVFQQLYCNYESFWVGTLFAPAAYAHNTPYRRLAVNVIKICVDTAQARIAKDKPRVFVLPNSADSRLIKKAENLTKFLDGAFHAGKVYESAEDAFRDGGIYGDGYVRIYEKNGQIMSHPVKVDEVVIDAVVGMFNDPQEIHWEHPTPRTELLARYPDHTEAINRAMNSWRGDMAFMSQADMISVTYSWRKQSQTDAGDGRYAVCIAECTLESGEWEKDYLPIVRWQWTPPTYGCFGMGIAQELEGMQASIAEILRNVMASIHLFAIPRVWLEKSSNVSQHTLSNEEGTVNYYAGSPPIFSTPPAASPDIYQFLQWMIDQALKQVGLSQMTAQSEKPAGLNSGVAMRTYQDVETQRFAIVGQRWERFHVEIGRIVVDMAADMFAKNKKLQVKIPGRAFIESVDWKDASMSADQYEMQAFPTSILPRTPEGQLQTVQEMTQSGFMPEDVLLAQMRVPNLNAWIDEKTASRDNINLCLSRIRDKGKYVAPNAIANIDMCVEMAMSAYLRADNDEHIPPERVDLLLRFLQAALDIQATKNAPPTPPPGTPGPPGAGPPPPIVGQAPAPPPAPMAAAGAGPISAAA